jgi:hypothetical protein
VPGGDPRHRLRKWLDLGYCVRRGETALWIWMPVPPSRKAIAEWEAAGADKDKKPQMRFRMGPVFDRSQVDPLPAPAQPAVLEPPISAVDGDDLEWAFTPLTAIVRTSLRAQRSWSYGSLGHAPAVPTARGALSVERRSLSSRPSRRGAKTRPSCPGRNPPAGAPPFRRAQDLYRKPRATPASANEKGPHFRAFLVNRGDRI